MAAAKVAKYGSFMAYFIPITPNISILVKIIYSEACF
jgi:hypothetical protein